MNSVSARITNINVAGKVKSITLEAGGITFSVLVLETDNATDREGDALNLLFKETEVSIGLRADFEISLRNRIPGKILAIERGKLLSRITLETSAGPVSSIITTASTDALSLKKGLDAVAYIKTNDIMLSRE